MRRFTLSFSAGPAPHHGWAVACREHSNGGEKIGLTGQ
jgi:hypothetical protein